jgi:hypothetical protein
MTTDAISMPRTGSGAEVEAGPAGFGWLLRSEWTKFRTVRGWVIGMIVAAILTVFLGLFLAGNNNVGCGSPGGRQLTGKACLPYIPHGPGGEVVTDSFNFAHQPLTGNGTITARVISLTGKHAASRPGRRPASSSSRACTRARPTRR